MLHHPLHKLVPYGQCWIQSCHRILENHRNINPANATHVFFAQCCYFLILKTDRSAGDFPRWCRNEPHNRIGWHTFSTAGFNDNNHGLCVIKLPINTAHWHALAANRLKCHMKVFYIQYLVCPFLTYFLSRGSRASCKPSPNTLNANMVNDMKNAGNKSVHQLPDKIPPNE